MLVLYIILLLYHTTILCVLHPGFAPAAASLVPSIISVIDREPKAEALAKHGAPCHFATPRLLSCINSSVDLPNSNGWLASMAGRTRTKPSCREIATCHRCFPKLQPGQWSVACWGSRGIWPCFSALAVMLLHGKVNTSGQRQI